MDKIRILVLAAGKGKRMGNSMPKALVKVNGKMMIKHLLDSIHKSNVDNNPTIVIGYEKEQIISELGNKYNYVIQNEQLGTGHAVMSAYEFMKDKAENVMVLPSDHPFISSETIKKLAQKHLESNEKITIATVSLPNFKDWRSIFYTSFCNIYCGQD